MDIRDDYRLSAAHVVKVANGANPATLPIERPTQFQLTVNLKTAAAIGVLVPAELLYCAPTRRSNDERPRGGASPARPASPL